jgi:predicted transcriptional regulator
MTRDVITAQPQTSLQELAKLLEEKGIKRVPIVDEGKVVGIVSRANLIQALATPDAGEGTTRNDLDIRNDIITRLEAEPWARPCLLNVIVHNGIVDLWGMVESRLERDAVRAAAETTPGVCSVLDHLHIVPARK